jgi:hypothetical protein
MTEHKNIHMALASAQAEMMPPEKNAENPAFKRNGVAMKYADLHSVVESVRGPLTKHGISWGWSVVEFAGGLAVQCRLTHGQSETFVSCAVPMYVDRNNMHGLKSADTYAKRISLESVTGQAPADDDDGNAAAQAAPKDAPKRQPAPDAERIANACEYLTAADDLADLRARWSNLPKDVQALPAVVSAKDARKAALETPPADDLGGDFIPH